MAEQGPVRVLVFDSEPGLIEDYRLALCGGRNGHAGKSTADLDLDFFASAVSCEGLPDIEFVACGEAAEAVEAVERATARREPFALAFVDPCGVEGLETLARMRALDPRLCLVVVTAAADIEALDLSAHVPPADRLYYVQKPFHSVEIRQLALALGEKWRGERAMAERPAARTRSHETESAGGADGSLAGVLVFDAGDRLLSANPTIARMFPELATILEPGARYEDIQREMARRLLPRDTLYRVEAWLRDRLEWHAAGGGLHEQRLRGPRWVLMAEARVEGQGTTCQYQDISELKRREARRAVEAHLTQVSKAFARLCDRLYPNLGAVGIGPDDGKVVSFPVGATERRPGGRGPAGPQGSTFNDLLGKLRAVAQRQRLLPERLDLEAVVTEFAQAGEYTLPAPIQVGVVAGADLWPVLVDRGGLTAGLEELVRNACEAMPEGGHLILEVANARGVRGGPIQADHVRLSVGDTGPGMSTQFAERALNPFFTTKAQATHDGLGLSAVHGFVVQSGGRMEIAAGNGQGTRVDLYFPRAAVSRSVLETSNGSAHGRPSEGSLP
jgi:PAS domain-containing protein